LTAKETILMDTIAEFNRVTQHAISNLKSTWNCIWPCIWSMFLVHDSSVHIIPNKTNVCHPNLIKT